LRAALEAWATSKRSIPPYVTIWKTAREAELIAAYEAEPFPCAVCDTWPVQDSSEEISVKRFQ
jgi:hypothetical protein